MTAIAFGSLAPCRSCNGTGSIKNPERGSKDAARERSRLRRHGQEVAKPDIWVPCVECKGTGVLPPQAADQEDLGRGDRVAAQRALLP